MSYKLERDPQLDDPTNPYNDHNTIDRILEKIPSPIGLVSVGLNYAYMGVMISGMFVYESYFRRKRKE